MSTEYGTNRWWEYYLVRYLMPSIAGVVIVIWLCAKGGDALRATLLLPPDVAHLNTASLTLIFLYGNLFCYVASYPILVFHVTRVLDFMNQKWPGTYVFDGYLSTLVVVLGGFALAHYGRAQWYRKGAIALVAWLVIVQARRLYKVMSLRTSVRGVNGEVSPAFGFAYSLAKRRGLLSVTEKTPIIQKKTAWRQDFMATYRHLREHANSGFIFLLELALAALVSLVIQGKNQTPEDQLSAVGALFALWAAPAVFVHLLGQHLERRFSQYDRRVEEARTGKTQKTGENTGSDNPTDVEVTIVKFRA
jgi:hypothetical protein